MKYILDTHVLLWWLGGDKTLSNEAFKIISDSNNLIFISAASAWEIAIKKALNKLQAPDDLEGAIKVCNFESLPISIRHALLAGELPNHHQDPFDRMLIAQSMIEDMTLITRNQKQLLYDVHTITA